MALCRRLTLSAVRSCTDRASSRYVQTSASGLGRQFEIDNRIELQPLLDIHGREVDDEMQRELNRYASYQPTPVSIAHFIHFGRTKTVDQSYLFLRRELPVRLANIMQELKLLPKALRRTAGCGEITQLYLQSFKELLDFQDVDDFSDAAMENFGKCLSDIRTRHDHVVHIMARAALAVKDKYPCDSRLPKFEKNIQYFLDRLYASRISVRMLINQHTMLYNPSPDGAPSLSQSRVGAIDLRCKVIPIVRQAYGDARFLSEQYYLSAPELRIRAFDFSSAKTPVQPPPGTELFTLFRSGSGVPADDLSYRNANDTVEESKQKRADDIECVYVPSHLHHVLFELFKNSMRATVEYVGDDDTDLPPIEVVIVKTAEDVSIKVCDRGGGIPRRHQKNVFDYLYTTAPKALDTTSGTCPDLTSQMQQQMMDSNQSVPLAGYGYGLPLSRLYARYLTGDLELFSIHGFGTEAVIYLQAIPDEARERLPVFNVLGSRKIYEANVTVDDWTDNF